MIFLILPVWWVPCVLVPIVPVLSLVPWWCTRGATPKDTRIFNAKRRQGEQHFKHEENKIQIRIVVIPYIVPMFFIERDLLKTCAALRIYPSAKLETKNRHVSSESHLQLQLPPGRLFQTASCWVPSWAPMRRHHLYGVGPGSWFMSPNFDVSSLRDFEQGNHKIVLIDVGVKK